MAAPTVGTKGQFRHFSFIEPWIRGSIAPNENAGYVSIRLDSNGEIQHWDATSGEPSGTRNEAVGTGEERAKFDGAHVFTSQPGGVDGHAVVFEWISR